MAQKAPKKVHIPQGDLLEHIGGHGNTLGTHTRPYGPFLWGSVVGKFEKSSENCNLPAWNFCPRPSSTKPFHSFVSTPCWNITVSSFLQEKAVEGLFGLEITTKLHCWGKMDMLEIASWRPSRAQSWKVLETASIPSPGVHLVNSRLHRYRTKVFIHQILDTGNRAKNSQIQIFTQLHPLWTNSRKVGAKW